MNAEFILIYAIYIYIYAIISPFVNSKCYLFVQEKNNYLQEPQVDTIDPSVYVYCMHC